MGKFFLLLSLMCPNPYIFASMLSWKFSTGNRAYTVALWSVNDSLRYCFSGLPGLWPRGSGALSWTPVYIPITPGRQDFSWVSWHMVLDPTASIKALLFVDGHQIIEVGT